jgi:diguanylate cyclase (GGDEF)-like protein
MGRTVGVIHTTSAIDTPFPDHQVSDLGTLAKLAGARIGLLRVMSETQLQASTDTLTGLLNRRSFEQKVKALRADGTPTSVAMADLDHFKDLNDTYGHPTGDRALVLFAKTLQNSLRTGDVIGRHGGEEFVIALPDCSAANARTTLDTLRTNLEAAITVAGLPMYTASFGVVDAHADEDLPQALERADAALFMAKSEGRNRVVIGEGDPACQSEEPEVRRLRTSVSDNGDAKLGGASALADSDTLPDVDAPVP